MKFQQKINKYKEEGKIIIPIDESGFVHSMPRTHGYSGLGTRCYGIDDWSAYKRTNVIGAMMGKDLLTVSLFECNIDTNVFNSWTKQDLLPKLPQNSVVVMDNAGFHKSSDLKLMIENAGHILEYLPPYSPDLNPIERKWAQAKAIRRKYRCSIETLFHTHMP